MLPRSTIKPAKNDRGQTRKIKGGRGVICKKRTYFECIIPEKNKKAFYVLIAGQDLFGHILIRAWGRIGTQGQPKKRQRFIHESEMLIEYNRVYSERIKHQYKPVKVKSSVSKNGYMDQQVHLKKRKYPTTQSVQDNSKAHQPQDTR